MLDRVLCVDSSAFPDTSLQNMESATPRSENRLHELVFQVQSFWTLHSDKPVLPQQPQPLGQRLDVDMRLVQLLKLDKSFLRCGDVQITAPLEDSPTLFQDVLHGFEMLENLDCCDQVEERVIVRDLLPFDIDHSEIGPYPLFAIASGIFAYVQDGLARVKRFRFLASGKVEVVSDNKEIYPPETLDQAELEQISIIGRVRWIGHTV